MPAMHSSTLVVTGTDTDVGKTIITAAIVGRLHQHKIRAAGIKPVETGCAHDEDHNLIAADGAILQSAAPWVPANTVAPYRFAPPIAVAVAAKQSGMSLRIEDLVEVVENAKHYGDFLVIEGAGGALSPLAEGKNTLDLAKALSAPILIAAKDTLGTQSQTLAVIEAARQRELHIAGVVLTRFEADENIDAQANAETITEWGKVRVFGHLTAVQGDAAAQIAAVGVALEELGLIRALVDLRPPT